MILKINFFLSPLRQKENLKAACTEEKGERKKKKKTFQAVFHVWFASFKG